jgi:threonine synthase
VVVLVTGTGLKTPQAVEGEVTGAVVEIEADVDALLAELGVTA